MFAEKFQFLEIPHFLPQDPVGRDIASDAKILYTRRFNPPNWEPGSHLFAVTMQNEVRCTASVRMPFSPLSPEEVYVNGIITENKHRGKGIARFALFSIAEIGGREGFTTLSLVPSTEHHTTIYHRMGFEPRGRLTMSRSTRLTEEERSFLDSRQDHTAEKGDMYAGLKVP